MQVYENILYFMFNLKYILDGHMFDQALCMVLNCIVETMHPPTVCHAWKPVTGAPTAFSICTQK